MIIKDQVINAIKFTIRRSKFAPTLRRIFRSGPLTNAIEVGRKNGWSNAAKWLISTHGRAVLEEPDFRAAMRYKTNVDIETEYLLTELRKLLLLDDKLLDDSIIQETLCSLLYQCLNNEYVWYVSEEEIIVLNEKQNIIDQINDLKSTPWKLIAQLFMYSRPNQVLKHKSDLHDVVKLIDTPCVCLNKFLDSYSTDYKAEIETKNYIKCFEYIYNPVSRKIANTYEEYPYPRWVKLENTNPSSRKNRLLELYDENDLAFMDKPFKVLVAGCGTGYGAIEYALSYDRHAHILAIDLSKASLAYATNMARKYDVKNIEFMQMDLLDLPKLEDQFDIVECTGVLHHMKDPVEGGKALISNVREGGLIHISLYSELARREIVTFRKIYNLEPTMSDDEIREYRQKIMQEYPDIVDGKLSLRADFFDLNRCRDLLFHPLEHRFTVSQIAELLDALELEFMGFERPEIIRTQYWTNYPSKKDWRSLSRWDEFEKKHPSAFGSLYQIWAKK